MLRSLVIDDEFPPTIEKWEGLNGQVEWVISFRPPGRAGENYKVRSSSWDEACQGYLLGISEYKKTYNLA